MDSSFHLPSLYCVRVLCSILFAFASVILKMKVIFCDYAAFYIRNKDHVRKVNYVTYAKQKNHVLFIHSFETKFTIFNNMLEWLVY